MFVLQMDGQTKAVYTTIMYVLKSNVSRALNSFGGGVKEHWKTYAKTHHRSYYERGNTSEAVVEGVIDGDDDNDNNNDDDDCLISLPGDGVPEDEEEETRIAVTGV